MKTNIIVLFIAAILLCSCQSYKVETLGYKDEVKKFGNIAVLNVYVLPPNSPRPSMKKGYVLSKKYSPIKDEMNQFNLAQKDTVANYFISKLKEHSGIDVLAGKDLYSRLTPEVLDSLNISQYSSDLWQDGFPKLGLPENTLHLINLSNYYYPHLTFVEEGIKEQKTDLAKICDFLQVDGLVAAEVHIEISATDVRKKIGNRQMVSNIVFFDKHGNKLCRGHLASESKHGEIYDIDRYKKDFNKYFKFTDAFLGDFWKGEDYSDYLGE